MTMSGPWGAALLGKQTGVLQARPWLGGQLLCQV